MILRAALAALSLLPALACETAPSTVGARTRSAAIVIDGDTGEWPSDAPVIAVADDTHLYIRFNPADGTQAIQAAPFTTRLLIDADNNPATGSPVAGLGVELDVALSPAHGSSTNAGSSVAAFEPDGVAHALNHADAGFFFLPSYASPTYEARLDLKAVPTLAPGSTARVRIDQVNPDSSVRWSAETTVAVPNRPGVSPRPAPLLPAKPASALRVMSQNVLYSSPLKNPDAFRRSITAVNPDVILFQEWFNTPQAVIQNWVNTNLGAGWTVVSPDANEGVAVATRLPITETVADLLPDSGPGRNARFIGVLVQTKLGPVFAASVHLKCCGGANGSEDQRRVQEATSINRTVADVLARHPDAGVIIGGDYNLVGTRTPLDTMRAGLGAGGGDLTPVETITLGEPAALTWVDADSEFSPGRLDWIVVDESTTAVLRSFTLDTRRLADRALRDAGLQREDSHGSDHLPVVVDLVAP